MQLSPDTDPIENLLAGARHIEARTGRRPR